MKLLWGYLKKFKKDLIISPFFKLLETLLELANPILVADIIDIGVTTGDINYCIKMGVLIIFCNILRFLFNIISYKASTDASVGVSREMRKDAFAKIASLSHNELDSFGTASLVNRLTNDIQQVETAINTFMRTLVRVPFLLIGAFVLSLMINVKVSLIFLVLIPILLVFLVWYMKKTTPIFHTIREKLDKISDLTRENLSGTRVIRAFNKQDAEQKRFEESTEDFAKTNIRISKITVLLDPLIYTLVDIATVALLAIGGWQINIGGMSQGDVIALADYITIISLSLLLLSQIIAIFVRSMASMKRINEVFDTQPAVQEKEGAKTIRRFNYNALMEFKNVSFNYSLDSSKKSFIKDLSFEIYPRQTIGIIGGTGSGKSTLASLMMRFYDPTSGEILLKGKNLKDYTFEQLRSTVSIVQQRSTLFSGSLRENMKLRDSNATDEEIKQALEISQAWPFVSEWANGLDYQIMAGGKNVSGGQMQRLTIARALIGHPELLILDDSSSALDFMTDLKLRKALKTLDCAVVLISQRATSIKNADLIIVLDNGDVVGMGKHNSLMKNCDIYREIYESQSK